MVGHCWRLVHRRAAKEAATVLGLASLERIMIKAAVAIAVLLALAFWRSEDAARDEMIARLVIGAIIVSLFPSYILTIVFGSSLYGG